MLVPQRSKLQVSMGCQGVKHAVVAAYPVTFDLEDEPISSMLQSVTMCSQAGMCVALGSGTGEEI